MSKINLLLLFMLTGLLSMKVIQCAENDEMVFIYATNPGFNYSDYIAKEIISSPWNPQHKAVRFTRPLVAPGKGYGKHDNPGARIRFKTASTHVHALLYYNPLHLRSATRNSNGTYFINGENKPEYIFSSPQKNGDGTGVLTINLPVPSGNTPNTYELILPYGDSVDFLGIKLMQGAKFEPVSERPDKRLVFYGDSVTHGFTASDIRYTYPFRLTEALGWQMRNVAVGGRASSPADAKAVATIDGDALLIALGVNDWQGGRDPQQYQSRMQDFMKTYRALRPDMPIVIITPLWVNDNWKPKKAKYLLDEYRQALKALVANLNDSQIMLINGPELIDHDKKYFDRVLVHPNDFGFEQMAARLTEKLSTWKYIQK